MSASQLLVNGTSASSEDGQKKNRSKKRRDRFQRHSCQDSPSLESAVHEHLQGDPAHQEDSPSSDFSRPSSQDEVLLNSHSSGPQASASQLAPTKVGSISQGSYGWHSIHSSVSENLQSLQVDEDGGPPCAEGNNGWPYIHDSAFTSLWNSQGVEDGGSLTDADHLEHSAAQDVRPTTCTHDL
jgi:hypothetical protein